MKLWQNFCLEKNIQVHIYIGCLGLKSWILINTEMADDVKSARDSFWIFHEFYVHTNHSYWKSALLDCPSNSFRCNIVSRLELCWPVGSWLSRGRIIQQTVNKKGNELGEDGSKACLSVVRQSSNWTPPQLCIPITTLIFSNPAEFFHRFNLRPKREARGLYRNQRGLNTRICNLQTKLERCLQ